MKQYLITGAAGFLGSHLTRKLINQGHRVQALILPQDTAWRLADLSFQEKDGQLVYSRVDLRNSEEIKKVIKHLRPEIIFHCASYGGMPFELESDLIYDVNIRASRELFNACKTEGFEAFIATGSSSEYGFKNQPLSEEMILEPRSDYAVAKAAFTQFLYKEASVNMLAAYTVRPFAVYGDAELSTRLIPTILKGALLHTPLFLSAPHYVRDYIYVHDMIDILIAVAEKKPRDTFIFNAGTGTQSSIADVLAVVTQIIGNDLEVHWGTQQPRPWEPSCWVADTTRSATILNWQASHTLEQGLRKALSWFKEYFFKPIEEFERQQPQSSLLPSKGPHEASL